MRILALLSLVLLLVSCEKENPILEFEPPSVGADISSFIDCPDVPPLIGNISSGEELEIIKTIYNTYYSDYKTVPIDQVTEFFFFNYHLASSLFAREGVTIDSSLISDYVAKNANTYILSDVFDPPFQAITQTELDCLILKPANSLSQWYNFYGKYPSSPGYLEFAMPSYANNVAFAVYSVNCNSLCGMSYVVKLEKQNNKWTVVSRILYGMG